MRIRLKEEVMVERNTSQYLGVDFSANRRIDTEFLNHRSMEVVKCASVLKIV